MLHNFEIVLLDYQKCLPVSKLHILLLTLITLLVHAHRGSIPLPASAMQSTYDGIIDQELPFKTFPALIAITKGRLHDITRKKIVNCTCIQLKVTCHCYAVFILAWKSELTRHDKCTVLSCIVLAGLSLKIYTQNSKPSVLYIQKDLVIHSILTIDSIFSTLS